MKNIVFGASMLAIAAATPAHALLGYDVAEVRDEAYVGGSFNTELADEYRTLALYEADAMYDWIDADYYAAKAMQAASGDTPMPASLDNWDVEDPALAEMQDARAQLVAALGGGARDAMPDKAAHAQAKFDCWVEQQEEGWQTAHIQACKDEFYAALAALSPAPAPAPVAMEPKFKRIESGAVVYFDHDSDLLREDARQVLATLAAQLDGDQDIVVTVTGHADASGPADYNLDLSKRRADTVIYAITDLGLTLAEIDDLDVEARGENALAVQTEDGVRLEENRRVVIEAYAREMVDPMADKTAMLK